jgi:PIN domain nuclease of toxin-antitoxin system
VKLLVDSHILIWAIDDPTKLSPAATTALQDPDNELLLSVGSIWEIAIKVGLEKLTLKDPFRVWMNQAIADLDLRILPITVNYADAQATLPDHHRDPFDRLIVAQALTKKIPIVSADAKFDPYGVTRLW